MTDRWIAVVFVVAAAFVHRSESILINDNSLIDIPLPSASRTPVLRPQLTQTTSGWSSGWKESERNWFTPMAMSCVMTGWQTGMAVEVAELVYHFNGEGRETPQSHIDATGDAFGFFNVYPLMVAMRSMITERLPDLALAFDRVQETPEFLQLKSLDDGSHNEHERIGIIDRANAVLFHEFGNAIQVFAQLTHAIESTDP